MCILLFLLLSIIVPRGCQEFNSVTLSNYEYGPYQADWIYIKPCNGPKLQNMTYYITNLTKTPENQYIITVNSTFLITGPIEELKIDVYTQNKKSLYSTRVKNLCQNFAIGPILMHVMKIDSSCVVKKGNYIFELNITDMATMFLGSKFFYGSFQFKNLITSRKGNIFCSHQEVKFSKKTTI